MKKLKKVKLCYISTDYELNILLCGKYLKGYPKIYILEDGCIIIDYLHLDQKTRDILNGIYVIDNKGDYTIDYPPYQDYGDELDSVILKDNKIIFKFIRAKSKFEQILEFEL